MFLRAIVRELLQLLLLASTFKHQLSELMFDGDCRLLTCWSRYRCSAFDRQLLAALRGGIKTVLIPEENAKDLVEISESIKKGLEIVPVSRLDEVLARAMTRKPERHARKVHHAATPLEV